jgi:hypothetical protein
MPENSDEVPVSAFFEQLIDGSCLVLDHTRSRSGWRGIYLSCETHLYSRYQHSCGGAINRWHFDNISTVGHLTSTPQLGFRASAVPNAHLRHHLCLFFPYAADVGHFGSICMGRCP